MSSISISAVEYIPCWRNQCIACIATRSHSPQAANHTSCHRFSSCSQLSISSSTPRTSLSNTSQKITSPSSIPKHQTHSSPDLSRRQRWCLYHIHLFHFRITNIDLLLYLAAFCRSQRQPTSWTPDYFTDLSCICHSQKLESFAYSLAKICYSSSRLSAFSFTAIIHCLSEQSAPPSMV
jgi:hypothetical protein